MLPSLTCRYKKYPGPRYGPGIYFRIHISQMATERADPETAIHMPSTRTSVDQPPTLNPNTPQKSMEDFTPSTSGVLDVEKDQERGHEPLPVVDEFLVEFNGPDDPDNPKNWSTRRRWGITVVVGLLVFTVTFASSIFSVNIGIVKDKFQVTQVVATLGVALFVLVRQPTRYTLRPGD